MSVEVIQSATTAKFGVDAAAFQQKPVVKNETGAAGAAAATKQALGGMSPKHNVLIGEGKSDKLLQQVDGMGIHTRHASVPESLLLKGSSNPCENGWSPAHERFTGSLKPDSVKHTSSVVKLQSSKIKQQQQPNAGSGARSQSQQQNGSRTTDEESVDYDSSLENTSVSSFDFNRERGANGGGNPHGRSVVGALHSKPAPSKWDDAEKWLVSADSVRSKPKMQQLLSTIPSHVIINASKKAALLGSQRIKLGMEALSENGLIRPDDIPEHMKKIDAGSGPYKFSFMPSPATGNLPAKTRSMSSLDRYPLEELLGCDDAKQLKVVSLCDEDDISKPALRTEKPTSDFPTIDGQTNLMDHGSGKVDQQQRSPVVPRDGSAGTGTTASYVTPPGLRSVSMRDMGTEMTPIASQEPSRTGTPLRATTPTIRSPVSSRPSTPGRLKSPTSDCCNNSNTGNKVSDSNNDHHHHLPGDLLSSSAAQTPAAELSEKQLQAKTRQEILALGTQLGKANIAAWASREEEEEDASKCLKNIDLEEVKRNVLEARAAAWEEAEKSKYEARYKREEAKIIAWENHEKAKAEAEMRRIEVKVERMRSHSHEQLMNKLAVARRRAEDLRAAAEARRVEQAAKTAQRAEYIRHTGNMPPTNSSPFSIFLQLGRLCC